MVLAEILEWLGPHRGCVSKITFNGEQCSYATAFAIWMTLWGKPANVHSPAVVESSEHDPIAVASFYETYCLTQSDWPPALCRPTRIAWGKRDMQTLESCFRGSFDQFLGYVSSFATARYPFKPGHTSLMYSKNQLYLPRRVDSPTKGHAADDSTVRIQNTDVARHASEPMKWRFAKMNGVRHFELEGQLLPELYCDPY